ncbi:hypothetical protein LBMAG47_14440 [Planctomycetia bacterium]|nr:hypothetical protein LBMAG47_14440 [Planctomycetia bacterium]
MLKLHAGVSKKVGLPGFSSASASCTIEAELDSSLLNDTAGFQIVVQRAYQSCEQAVQDEIARLQGHNGANNDGTDHATSSQNRIQDFAPSSSPDSAQAYSALPHTTNGSHARSQGPSRASQPMVAQEPVSVIEVRTAPAIQGATVTANQRAPVQRIPSQPSPRPATASQVKAIRAIAARRKIDLVGLLRERFGLTTADELGIRQASALIDELKSDEGTTSPGTNGHANGNGAYAVTGGAR